jgi:hypothetical protein
MSRFNTTNFLKILAINLLIVLAVSSCAKQPKGVRAQVKTTPNDMSPNTTNQATQQAAALNANYTIATLSLPEPTQTGHIVNVELQMPNGSILPLTTRHENGNNYSEGVYNDTQLGNQVHIQASCSAGDCSKYLLLVTVYRSNQSVFQTFAISYSNDCKFNIASTSYATGTFFRDLTAAENRYMNIGPVNDMATCTL